MKRGKLPVPEAVRSDRSAVEVLRMWVASGDQFLSLHLAWSDPETWGIVLAGLAQHVASAAGMTAAPERRHFLERVRRAFLSELETPTGDSWGGPVEARR